MTDHTRKLTEKDLDWVRRQLAHPSPVYLVSEMARLCGPHVNHRRLRRMLIRKGVIRAKVGKGRGHLVERSKLKTFWPELWLSIRTAWQESGLLGDVPEEAGEPLEEVG